MCLNWWGYAPLYPKVEGRGGEGRRKDKWRGMDSVRIGIGGKNRERDTNLLDNFNIDDAINQKAPGDSQKIWPFGTWSKDNLGERCSVCVCVCGIKFSLVE